MCYYYTSSIGVSFSIFWELGYNTSSMMMHYRTFYENEENGIGPCQDGYAFPFFIFVNEQQ